MNSYIEKTEDRGEKELLVAYRRVSHALASQFGWGPEDVKRAIEAAKIDIKAELEVKEIDPLTYRARPVNELVNEPAETAAKKGEPYIEKLFEYAGTKLSPKEIEKLKDYASQVMLVGV